MYNKVIIKDVYFNKEKVFDGSTEILKSNIKNIFLEYLIEIVKKAIYTVITIISLTIYNDIAEDLEWFYKNKGNEKEIRSLEDLVAA